MRLGILTGGGDVPGLNSAIKAATIRLLDQGHEMIGIRRGWYGLLHFNIDDENCEQELTVQLDRHVVRTIDRTGGTFLHTSRTNPANVKPKDVPAFLKHATAFAPGLADRFDFTPHVMNVLKHLDIDGLVTIGGDDTLSYSLHLHQAGFPVVAIPKTMDNDVRGTEYCIGFSTAITRSLEFINNMRTCTGSHERVAVIELFGRNSGETSLIASYLGNVDRCLISEVPFNLERLCDLLVADKRANPSNYSMLVVSEGATPVDGGVIERGEADAYGHRKLGGIAEMTAAAIKQLTQEDTLDQQLAYLMRSGAPDSLDRMVGISYANLAVDLVTRGYSGQMVALQNGTYTTVPIDTITQGLKRVDVTELYDPENYRPRVRHLLGKPMFLY